LTYNQKLAQRIRAILSARPDLIEKKMFGGVGFILHGNMVCGVQGDDMIVRIGVDNNDAALSQPFVRPFMPRVGKPMAGWVLVAPGGIETDQDLQQWVEQGYKFAYALPAKE
jgi:TfoX/Sxy family transcriptional regulator of competence genes